MPDKKKILGEELNDDQLNEVAGGRSVIDAKKKVIMPNALDADTESLETAASTESAKMKKKKSEAATPFNLKPVE